MFILWVLRFFVFTLYESPKYLMGRGRDLEAVEVVHKVAAYNGRTSSLKIEHLLAVDEKFATDPTKGDVESPGAVLDTSALAAVRRKFANFDASHVKALFATRKLAWSTSILIALWGGCYVLSQLCGANLAHSSSDRTCVSFVCLPSL